MFGISIALLFDIFFDHYNFLSIFIKIMFLITTLICYKLKDDKFNTSTILYTSTILILSVIQSIFIPVGSAALLGVMMLLGFLISAILKQNAFRIMHIATVCCFLIMCFLQMNNPELRLGQTANDMIVNYSGYLIVYFILSYCSYILKNKYNTTYVNLRTANYVITDKAKENEKQNVEIKKQNVELLEMHSTLNDINNDLERIVNERTDKIRSQNKILIAYSNIVSHQLRAPIARLKGLLNIFKMEKKPDVNFFMEKIENEAEELDNMIKQTSKDINSNIDIEKDYN
jgi:archaellum component FlaC